MTKFPFVIGASVLAAFVLFAPWGVPTDEVMTPTGAGTHAPARMVFKRGGAAAPILQAVEKVTGKENAAVALTQRADGRSMCILVHGNFHLYSTDGGMNAAQFPALAERRFAAANGPNLRIMSIYLSVAKQATGFREDQGDRVLVLVCPKDEWAQLALNWPK